MTRICNKPTKKLLLAAPLCTSVLRNKKPNCITNKFSSNNYTLLNDIKTTMYNLVVVSSMLSVSWGKERKSCGLDRKQSRERQFVLSRAALFP